MPLNHVHVNVPVQPQDNVAETVEKEEQLAWVDGILGPRIVERHQWVVRHQDDEPVVIRCPRRVSVSIRIGRVHLDQTLFEPRQLRSVDTPVGASIAAHGVEADQAHRCGVVHIAGRPFMPVGRRKPVSGGTRTGTEMCLEEAGQARRQAGWIWGDAADCARHESLRRPREDVDSRIGIEPAWHSDRLPPSDHGGGNLRCDQANTLAELFMVSVAADPRHGQAVTREGSRGAFKKPWQLWKPVVLPKTVAAVRLPGLVVRPGRALGALGVRASRVWRHDAAVEQSHEVRQLVHLGVVDRVAGHHHQLHGLAADRRVLDSVDGLDHGVDRVRVE